MFFAPGRSSGRTLSRIPDPVMLHLPFAGAILALSALPAAAQEPEGAADPVVEAHLEWNADHGGDWLLRRSDDLPTARYLYGLTTRPVFVPRTDAGFFELGRMMVDEAYGMFGVESTTLVEEAVRDIRLAHIGTSDKVAVEFTQWVRGVPVLDGSVNLLFTPQGGMLGLDSPALPYLEEFRTRPGTCTYRWPVRLVIRPACFGVGAAT